MTLGLDFGIIQTEDGEMGEFITARAGEELTGYTKEHIARLIRTGKVKGRKFALVWMVDKKSLLEYTEQARRNSDGRFGPQK